MRALVGGGARSRVRTRGSFPMFPFKVPSPKPTPLHPTTSNSNIRATCARWGLRARAVQMPKCPKAHAQKRWGVLRALARPPRGGRSGAPRPSVLRPPCEREPATPRARRRWTVDDALGTGGLGAQVHIPHTVRARVRTRRGKARNRFKVRSKTRPVVRARGRGALLDGSGHRPRSCAGEDDRESRRRRRPLRTDARAGHGDGGARTRTERAPPLRVWKIRG